MEIFNKIYKLNTKVCVCENVADEVIIINLDNGNYYNILGKSVKIWEAILDNYSISDLIQINSWEENITNKLAEFINTMLSENILVSNNLDKKELKRPEDRNKYIISIDDINQDIKISVFNDMQELLGLDPIHDTSEEIGWPEKPEQLTSI